jgi:hypothetical protein
MNKHIYTTNETKMYRVESIKGFIDDGFTNHLNEKYGINSMMMEIPKGSALIVERRNVNGHHQDMFRGILLSNQPNLRIVAISFNDVSNIGISFEG